MRATFRLVPEDLGETPLGWDPHLSWPGTTPAGIKRVSHSHLFGSNQASQHLHVFSSAAPVRSELSQLGWPGGMDYVTGYLAADDPARIIDQIPKYVTQRLEAVDDSEPPPLRPA